MRIGFAVRGFRLWVVTHSLFIEVFGLLVRHLKSAASAEEPFTYTRSFQFLSILKNIYFLQHSIALKEKSSNMSERWKKKVS